jgi:hypothetical protein
LNDIVQEYFFNLHLFSFQLVTGNFPAASEAKNGRQAHEEEEKAEAGHTGPERPNNVAKTSSVIELT